jgi:glucose/arabinose dehydrogenase
MKRVFSVLAILAALAADTVPSVQAAGLARVANTTLKMPATPPAYGFQVVKAFGDLLFPSPVAIVTPPDETNRLFIVEQRGRIAVITNLAQPTRSVFLDLTARVTTDAINGDERGLLGLAFHPGYATNGYFFVYYSTTTNTALGVGLHERLARFQVSPGDPQRARPDSELPLITQFDEAANHNGGDLHFGPDGYLYISLGDGGGLYDAFGNSQRIDKGFHSGIIRLDVDQRPGNLPPNPHAAVNTNATGAANYFVPADNPWIGATSFNTRAVDPQKVRTEFWAVGLRNPWRMSFDPVTGLLY